MVFIVVRSDRGFVWVPRTSYVPSGSVLINNVEVKSDILNASITRAAANKAGSCSITLNNQQGQWTGMFSKRNIIKIYADYDVGTTKIFEGFVRDVNPEITPYPKLVINGNDYAGEALLRTVNKQYKTATKIYAIFQDLVTNYLPGYTTTNVDTSNAYLNLEIPITFSGKKLLDCFTDLMTATDNNCCFYCDFNKDWHVFEKGSVYNSYEPIIYSRNLIRMQTEDTLSDMTTKITLYGQDIDGFPMMVTVSDDPEGVGVIHEVYRDTNITTYDSLVDRANYILNSKKTSELKGKSAIVKGMIGLNPGDTIYVFAPIAGIQGEYFVNEFTHDIVGRKITKTTCQFQVQHKRTQDLSTIIKSQMQNTQALFNIENPDDLENSYNFPFNDNSNVETMTNLTITGGKLQLTSGSTGSMISSTRTTVVNVTKAELKYSGWNLGDSTFEVSVDGGLNYQTLTVDTLLNISYSGNNLKIRVTLNSTAGNPSPNIDSLTLLYT